MNNILNPDISKIVFKENVTKDGIDKFNSGDLFGLKIKSYSAMYPSINGDTGNLLCKMNVTNAGEFNEPYYGLFKKINNYIIKDMITGKLMFIVSKKEDVLNIISIITGDHANGLSKYYYLADTVLNGDLPILTINLKENVLDIAEDYKIVPENTLIEAIDSYKKLVATKTIPRSNEFKYIQDKIEKEVLTVIDEQYKGSISEAYDLAMMDNIIYDVENNASKCK